MRKGGVSATLDFGSQRRDGFPLTLQRQRRKSHTAHPYPRHDYVLYKYYSTTYPTPHTILRSSGIGGRGGLPHFPPYFLVCFKSMSRERDAELSQCSCSYLKRESVRLYILSHREGMCYFLRSCRMECVSANANANGAGGRALALPPPTRKSRK